MFGSFPALANSPAHAKVDPKDVPPPTPINLPRYQPYARENETIDPSQALPTLLEQSGRSAGVLGPLGFSAIGLDLRPDATFRDLIPDPAYIPDFSQWNTLTTDDARDRNQATRRPLRTGNLSPGCQVYLERRRELSNNNEDAFRTVRRIPPPKGKQQARLGNAYEFFRCLELLTTYWDDPTHPAELPPSPEMSATEVATTEGSEGSQLADAGEAQVSNIFRISSGQSMPPEFRQTLVAAFVKLVAYDFGCNVSMSRVEPRLHLGSLAGPRQRKTYIPSHCHFVFQSPMSREAARAGTVYGPVAAVSARPTVDFTTPDVESAQSLDLAREVTAALITAQHRAREGRAETRFGEGQWWSSKPRWGGGSGGPIGREIDKFAVPGDKDVRPSTEDGDGVPATKKPRKNMSIYDNYRMVRPPASAWDRKAKYEAIGMVKGEGHDDIFVVSSLFHHISVLRVRVPLRLLEVLEGSPEQNPARRSWGMVGAWRSPWYDLFDTDQRIAAMQLLWSVMAYQMRQESANDDVVMADA
ncbi:hypothetical protein HRG_011087 [Hirsutella rhossiliensis]|uniref:Uncharacterized protein n=1 Tax=Hirsutella rhossiliensis TaxID=111463 RepID=A0A9P8SDI3_9HYPO|nr:uncharacterized protein HRG_11087 [Hirsutella rhossiliensis]KAH0957994.1 hypothetical protein HRG_11087 [Hirsutella rhossiliensis]